MKIQIIINKMPGADPQGGGGGNTYGIGPQAIIGAASGAIGMGVQRLGVGYDYRKQREQQQKLNYQQIEFNDRMSRMQQQYALEMWEKTGYGAQKDQMKRAGLNPALMYGMSGGGGQTAQAGMGGAAPSAQDPNTRGATGTMMGMGIQTMAQTALLEAQKRNLDAQTEKLKSGKEVDVATVPKVLAETGKTKQDTEKSWQETHKMEMDNLIQQISQATDKDGKDTEGDIQKSAAVTEMRQRIEESAKRIELAKQQGLTQQEIQTKTQKEIELLKNEINWQALEVKEDNIGKFLTNVIKLLIK